jgi:acyl dehydratase
MQPSGDLYEAIAEGQTQRSSYLISEPIYKVFLELFEDTNPLHHDCEYAKAGGFEQPVMHGAILNGFLSNFVGMEFPGSGSLILSVHINYLKPTFIGDTIEIEAKVTHKLDSRRVIEMSVAFTSTNREIVVARAKVNVALIGAQE